MVGENSLLQVWVADLIVNITILFFVGWIIKGFLVYISRKDLLT